MLNVAMDFIEEWSIDNFYGVIYNSSGDKLEIWYKPFNNNGKRWDLVMGSKTIHMKADRLRYYMAKIDKLDDLGHFVDDHLQSMISFAASVYHAAHDTFSPQFVAEVEANTKAFEATMKETIDKVLKPKTTLSVVTED
jgi:hypothetical protein